MEVVLEAPKPAARRQDFDLQSATVCQRAGLHTRFGVVDGRGFEGAIDEAYSSDLAQAKAP
jgi:hypothetical protein